MKYVMLIIDGASDYPVPDLDGKTPLQVARKPNLDRLAAESAEFTRFYTPTPQPGPILPLERGWSTCSILM